MRVCGLRAAQVRRSAGYVERQRRTSTMPLETCGECPAVPWGTWRQRGWLTLQAQCTAPASCSACIVFLVAALRSLM